MVSSSSFNNVSTRNTDDGINASSSPSSPTSSSVQTCRKNHAEAQDDCADCMNDDSTMMNTTASPAPNQQQCQKNQKRCRHLYAQKLNNSAAICIDIGLYDRAISSLSKALKLSEQEQEEEEEEEPAEEQERNQENPNDDDDDDDDVIMEDEAEDEDNEDEDESMTMVCPCYHCTVDGCIEYSEMNKSYFMTENDTDNDECDGNDDNDAFLCQTITDADTDAITDTNTNSSSSVSASYIYQRPIQVTPQAIQEEHNMGSTLCLMIAFNLALAYHLKAISMQNNNNSSSSTHRQYLKYITVALKLYNHVLQWQARLIQQQNDNDYYHDESSATIHSGMRFKMIILNNMSQLYRQNEASSSSYQLCLQSLLSNIMLVVEYKTRIFNHNNASLSSLQLPYIMKADLERFIQNTSPLLMGNSGNGSVHQDHCASVA